MRPLLGLLAAGALAAAASFGLGSATAASGAEASCGKATTAAPTKVKIFTKAGTKSIRGMSFHVSTVPASCKGRRTIRYNIEAKLPYVKDFTYVGGRFTMRKNSAGTIRKETWAVACGKKPIPVRPAIDITWRPHSGTVVRKHYPPENSTRWPKPLCAKANTRTVVARAASSSGARPTCASLALARPANFSVHRYQGHYQVQRIVFDLRAVKNCSGGGKRKVEYEVQVRKAPGEEYQSAQYATPYKLWTNKKRHVEQNYNVDINTCGNRGYDAKTVLMRGHVRESIKAAGGQVRSKDHYTSPFNVCKQIHRHG